jgi:hypothetical protein
MYWSYGECISIWALVFSDQGFGVSGAVVSGAGGGAAAGGFKDAAGFGGAGDTSGLGGAGETAGLGAGTGAEGLGAAEGGAGIAEPTGLAGAAGAGLAEVAVAMGMGADLSASFLSDSLRKLNSCRVSSTRTSSRPSSRAAGFTDIF